MKQLHKPDLFGWSAFDETRNVDFNTTVWVRDDGCIVIDPMPLSAHDQAHLERLGGVSWIVITNSDHIRSAVDIAAIFGAKLAGPVAERDRWPFECDAWLTDGDELVEGLTAYTCEGSKTPGELVLRIGKDTLVTGDLIRAHHGGSLMTLPEAKLTDPAAAQRSVARIAGLTSVDAVLVGDGWHLFSGAGDALRALVAER
jgi:glyoxylase-like metal-dependent hydrolase (beta-lactamase superfamily II)